MADTRLYKMAFNKAATVFRYIRHLLSLTPTRGKPARWLILSREQWAQRLTEILHDVLLPQT